MYCTVCIDLILFRLIYLTHAGVFLRVVFLFVSHGLPFFVVLREFGLALDGCCKELNKHHYIVPAFVYMKRKF